MIADFSRNLALLIGGEYQYRREWVANHFIIFKTKNELDAAIEWLSKRPRCKKVFYLSRDKLQHCYQLGRYQLHNSSYFSIYPSLGRFRLSINRKKIKRLTTIDLLKLEF